ncbi:MAG: aminotransferase class I/II-fold pyridoxal phosphate-dependent enzyme [Gammaproteobacteria bacterium]|nr:aminotransferase class I/II-fold pyridoxal phosphate-dependent enzyme [Gammaproteobacteria bacterium]
MLKLDFNERSDYASEWLSKLELDATELWHYPDRTELESIIATHYSNSEKAILTEQNVFVSNGGDEAIFLLMRIIKESAKLILPLPAFSQYTWGLSSWSLDNIQIPANSDLSLDINSLKQVISKNKDSVVVITSPNNPTGEGIASSELIECLRLAKNNNSWVFLDEAYIEFSEQKSAINLLDQFDNLVILRTLSKAYGLAGIRLGYLIGGEALLNEFKQRAIPFNVPAPSLAIAKAAFSDDAQKDMQNYTTKIKQNRNQLSQWLIDNEIQPINSEANFIFFKLDSLRAEMVKNALLKLDISIRVFTESYLSGCLRITVPFQLELLLTALSNILTPKLLCFDMDGVLIDTSSSYDNAIKATVKEFTGQQVTDTAINDLRSQGGYNNDWVLTQALIAQIEKESQSLHSDSEVLVSPSIEKVTDCFQQFYLGDESQPGFIRNEQVLLSPITNQQLQRFCIQNKTSLAIVTGRPRDEAMMGQKAISQQHAEWLAAKVVSDNDVEKSKPAPEGILKLKTFFDTSASWMFGDTPDDMQAAVNSGSVAIGIGNENRNSLIEAGADVVINDINDLQRLISTSKI